MGPLGRKVVTPTPPLSAVGGAQRGVQGHNFSTQWSHCFGFGPSRSSFLVLRRSKGWGSQLFDQWNQWMRSFGFGPSRSLSQGSLSEFSPLSFIVGYHCYVN